MKQVGWALFFAIMVLGQAYIVVTLADKKTHDERVREIEEQTALMNNQAAAHNLESEKLRRQYYEALVNAGFLSKSFLDYNIKENGSDEANNRAADKQ